MYAILATIYMILKLLVERTKSHYYPEMNQQLDEALQELSDAIENHFK